MSMLDITDLKNITFVTDQGSNIKKALENYKRLSCLAHCLNTPLRHTLDETFLNEEVPDVFFSIQSARRIVDYMKRSSLVVHLEKTLKQDIETRWNSIFILLNSFHTQYEEIANILLEKNKYYMISAYNKKLMEEIINFLKLFKDATDDLEGEKEPTLPFAVPWTYSLLNNCNIRSTDTEPMQKIKKRDEKFLMKKVLSELQDIHFVSTFLHPGFKELSVLSHEQRAKIHETVRYMYEDINFDQETVSEPPMKKFREWRSSNSHKKDEIEKYLNTEFSECESLLL